MFVKKEDEYAVECNAQVAPDCPKQGEFCSDEEDAQDWVEMECWIFSGEHWICAQCNIHYMRNLVSIRRDKAQDDKPRPDPDDLAEGIETVR